MAGKKNRKGPKQINLDQDGHIIISVMYAGKMQWWCNTCVAYVPKVSTQLVERNSKDA